MKYAWIALYLVAAVALVIKLDAQDWVAAFLCGVVNWASYVMVKQTIKREEKSKTKG